MNESSSSSSFEVLNCGSAMSSSGHSSPSAVITSHMDVDATVWLYMHRSSKYSGPLERVTNDCRVTVDLDASGQAEEIPDRLILTGDDKADVDRAVEAIELMVERCQQSVCVRKLPAQSEAVYEKVVQHVNDVVAGAQISLRGPADVIRVIGTEDEVADSVRKLRELCGVAEDQDKVVNGAAAAASAQGGRHRHIMKLETDLWKYMQKNVEFSDDVRRLKEEMHVDVVEAVSGKQRDEPEVELVFSGPDDDVTVAMDKTVLLISRCRATTSIKSVPCRDNKVFAKIVKFLPKVNNATTGLVSAASETVNVTGNDEEHAVCREKLEKLGLVFEDEPAMGTGVVTPALDVNPPPPPASFGMPGAGDETVPRTGLEVPGVATEPTPASLVEVPRGDSAVTSQFAADTDAAQKRPAVPGDVCQNPADQGEPTSAEFPVPLEAVLWSYIERRRRQQLEDLRDVYGVSVQSFRADDGQVRLRLNAVSADMLGCSQDALGQLLDQLNKSINVVAIETSAGEELPREVAQIFQQLAEGTDAIIEVAGSRINIIGSSEGTAECQQKIAAFMQQVCSFTVTSGDVSLTSRREKKLQFSGRHFKFPAEEIMSAQNFNFTSKFFLK